MGKSKKARWRKKYAGTNLDPENLDEKEKNLLTTKSRDYVSKNINRLYKIDKNKTNSKGQMLLKEI